MRPAAAWPKRKGKHWEVVLAGGTNVFLSPFFLSKDGIISYLMLNHYRIIHKKVLNLSALTHKKSLPLSKTKHHCNSVKKAFRDLRLHRTECRGSVHPDREGGHCPTGKRQVHSNWLRQPFRQKRAYCHPIRTRLVGPSRPVRKNQSGLRVLVFFTHLSQRWWPAVFTSSGR